MFMTNRLRFYPRPEVDRCTELQVAPLDTLDHGMPVFLPASLAFWMTLPFWIFRLAIIYLTEWIPPHCRQFWEPAFQDSGIR